MGFCFGVVQFLTVMLLVICTCTFVKIQAPKPMEQRTGQRRSLGSLAWRT
ncbi:hypothetical protein KC19_9G058500 [Ceratodon purpureus]|uniref:Protein kish n=1 Tax=Ceratodon purpureus TaxID=3225 RepID=A0A8T0GUK0_CERPU|nr:hypothetical protein KC19_9G058500 [Ceratodon purpureus]